MFSLLGLFTTFSFVIPPNAEKANAPSCSRTNSESSASELSDIEQDLLFLVDNLEKDATKGYYSTVVVYVEKGELKTGAIKTYGQGKADFPATAFPPVSVKPICENLGNIAFVRCIGKWAKAHENQCVRVWYSNGRPHADDDCQR